MYKLKTKKLLLISIVLILILTVGTFGFTQLFEGDLAAIGMVKAPQWAPNYDPLEDSESENWAFVKVFGFKNNNLTAENYTDPIYNVSIYWDREFQKLGLGPYNYDLDNALNDNVIAYYTFDNTQAGDDRGGTCEI